MCAMNPRLLRPLASGFNPLTPSTIEGLELWLDASESSTLTLNATTVSEWRDRRSGSNRKAVQATALNQPDYEPSAIGGKPGVYFPSATWMDTTGDTMGFAQPVTYFVVVKTPASGDGTIFDTDGTGRHIVSYDSVGDQMRMYAGAFVSAFTGDVAPGQDNAMALIFNGASSSAARNGGGLQAVGNTGAIGANSQIKLGAFANDLTQWNGRIAEFLVYNLALQAADVASLMAYARIKWGVA
jgi:hypothetical protein